MTVNPDIDLSTIPLRASNWPQIPARRVDAWIMGVDLGQSVDPTAICVLHHTLEPLTTWTPNTTSEAWKQDRTARFDVKHLERLPLGMSYPEQVEHVAMLLRRAPLDSARVSLVIDETGVGRAVGDIFQQAGLRPHRVTITAGLEQTQHGGRSWHVAKQILISRLDAALHLGELKIAAALSEAGALQEELKDFARSVSAAGRVQYSARAGKHDDLVLAVAISLWFACNRPHIGSEELRL